MINISTRSNIAIKRKDGSYDKIYCHSDGYLEHNGKMLDMFYKDESKINNLISLGDLSYLDMRVNPDSSQEHSFDYDKRQEGVTVAYGRDREEKNVNTQHYGNEESFLNSFKGTWCEYVYLYDENTKEWLYSEIPYNDETNLNFESLHKTLEEKNLIDVVEEKLDSLVRKEVDFIKDYDTYNFNDCYESYEDAYFETLDLFTKPEGLKNMIKTNNEFLTTMNEYLDDEEIRKVFNKGLAINDDIRNYIKDYSDDLNL